MSFYAYDTDGYLGDVASIGGWSIFRKVARELGGAAWEFAADGYTEDPQALANQLEDTTLNGSADSTRKLLVEYARKANECLILTDGEDGSEEKGAVYLHKEFDEDQHPRDENGRWTDGGGSGGGSKPSQQWDVGKISSEWAPASPSVFDMPGKFDGDVVDQKSLTDNQRAKIEAQLDDLDRRATEAFNAESQKLGSHARALANALNAVSFAREALEPRGRFERGLIALAEDGTMRGGALFGPKEPNDMELHYLGSFQRGSGSSLLKQVEKIAADKGYDGVRLYSTHFAENFYKSQGYKPIDGGDYYKRIAAGGTHNAIMQTKADDEEPLGVLAVSETFAQRVKPVKMPKPAKGAVYLRREYNEEDHPRDEHGRWTDGGGGSSDKPEGKPAEGKPSAEEPKGKHPGEGYSSEARVGADGKIYTTNVEDAVRALSEDRDVVLDQPRQVSTLLSRLAEIGREATAAGGKAKTYDLCRVSVKGSNLFCAESKGIPRIEMPQLKGVPVPGSFADSLPRDARGEVDLSSQFRDYLVGQGHKITDGEEKASYLRATQNELNGGKVAGLVDAIHNNQLADERLFVNRDNYILDGHHRWAANVTVDGEDGKFGDIKMPVARIDMGIIELLHAANKFAEDHGLPRVGKRVRPCSTCGPGVVFLTKEKEKEYNEEDHPRDELGRWTDGGGGGSGESKPEQAAGASGSAGSKPDPKEQIQRARERHRELKTRWAQVNNEILAHIQAPASPEVQAKMDELKSIVKEMNALQADEGTPEDIGLPGGPRDIVVVGAGPGGLAAATMAGTDGLDTLVIEANAEAGGQARFSSRIENFPGFPVGVTGEQLANNMYDQSERVGAEVKLGRAVTGLSYDPDTGLKTLTLSDKSTVTARSVIIAGGVQFNKVQFPGSEGSNVLYGDGKTLAEISKGKSALVIGGSNGAAQAALGAAQFAERVYLLSRSPITKGMSDYQVQAVRSNAKITVIENDSIQSLNRGESGDPISATTKGGQTFPTTAVGVFAGSSPKTDWLPPSVSRDAGGKVAVGSRLETSIPGVFAIGDVRQGSIGRIGAAVGDGQMASSSAWSYLDGLRKKKSFVWKAAKRKTRALTLAERNRTVDRLFDLDREYPYFGQTVEPSTK